MGNIIAHTGNTAILATLDTTNMLVVLVVYLVTPTLRATRSISVLMPPIDRQNGNVKPTQDGYIVNKYYL